MIARDDSTAMRGKGSQFAPHGRRVRLAFPGGAGYGNSAERDPSLIKRNLARGYISAEAARRDYGLHDADIAVILDKVKRGDAA